MAKKENATKNFVLRIDAEMMDAIETWAADEFRSTNGPIQYILDQALRKAGRLKKKKQYKKGVNYRLINNQASLYFSFVRKVAI